MAEAFRQSDADALDGDAETREKRKAQALRILEIEPGLLSQQARELTMDIALRDEIGQQQRRNPKGREDQGKDSERSFHQERRHSLLKRDVPTIAHSAGFGLAL
jgi:predicted phage gp36 major capsid-like protein